MTNRTVEDVLQAVEEKSRGRTRYEGKETFDDELMRAEILRLRHELHTLQRNLDTTADGKLLVSDLPVWFIDAAGNTHKAVVEWWNEAFVRVLDPGTLEGATLKHAECWSTHEAAEAAKEAGR